MAVPGAKPHQAVEGAQGAAPALSVVIPLLNEEENLPLLYPRLRQALESLGCSYEVIFVDDGSTDGTLQILKRFHQENSHMKAVSLRRNFGQTAAFSAGFDMARGDVVVTLDGDLQNHPEDIPKLLVKLAEGYDVVSGWRVHRKDRFLTRRLPSNVANFLISRLTNVKLHDYGCSLKAYRREVIKGIRLYGEMHRFIPAVASWMGVKVAEVPVEHSPRTRGRSIYGLSRTLRVLLDLVTVKFLLSYSGRPMQLFGLMGLVSGLVGVGLGIYLTVLKLFYGATLADRPLLLLAILLVVLGVQFVTMGLLGELAVRTYYESQDKPIYVVAEVLGDKQATSSPG